MISCSAQAEDGRIDRQVSFSSRTKDEILKQRAHTAEEKRAMLFSLTHAAASMSLSRDGVGVRMVTENHGAAKLYAQLASELYGLDAAISITQSEGLKARVTVVRLTGSRCRELLSDAGCFGVFEAGTPYLSIDGEDDAYVRAYIRGAFLGCGSVSDPGKSYHLEFVCRNEDFSKVLETLVCSMGIQAKRTQRKSSYVVYLKDGDEISDLITLMGGMTSTLEFEHARVLHGVANDVNRKNNFDTANMQKAARSAAQQLVDIEFIDAELGLGALPPKLREAAEARQNNPESTLAELSELIGVSKSGVNHRLTRLCDIAAELRLHGV